MEENKKSEIENFILNRLKLKSTTDKLMLGCDIGGSLVKLMIKINKKDDEIFNYLKNSDKFESIDIGNECFFFTKFQSIDFEKDLLPILQGLNKIEKIKKVEATGGGAYKFSNLMLKSFHIEFIKNDELNSLVYGYLFMNSYDCFYELQNFDKKIIIHGNDLTFPHLSVNIGSGVSILKVSSPEKYERCGGTLMGGGTLIGLSKLIMGIDSYNEILELAGKGNYQNVDLTVNDIYRGEQEKFKTSNLKENSVASSFGKIHEYILSKQKGKFKKEDIALSLLTMICFHITQFAVIYAHEHNINKIYYFGNFTRRGSRATIALAQASQYWDKNIKVRFNDLDGYLGALGSLIELQK